MPALDDIIGQKIQVLEAKQQKRVLKATRAVDGVLVERGGKKLISFSDNDYLGLTRHPDVIAAAKKALEIYGAGAGASRLITGNHPLYDELEAALAKYKGTEAACVFGSGYLANLGAIPALVGKSDLIVADRLVHACMIDAAKLSGATLLRFAHNNLDHCRMVLEEARSEHSQCIILTETVFSMDGDRAPIKELKALAKKYDAWLMTDDAHGLGIIPPQQADIQMGTLSKAAGSYGGYVCGSKTLIDYIKTSARSLIYSTALPPATLAASIASLRIIAGEPKLTEKPLNNARYFTSLLGMKEAESAIVPIVLKENDKVLKASAILEEHGLLVTAIRPPSVPENTARLRFAFSALHEKSHIEKMAAIIRQQGWVCEPSA